METDEMEISTDGKEKDPREREKRGSTFILAAVARDLGARSCQFFNTRIILSSSPLFVFLSLLLLLFFLSLISCYINLREKGGSMCVRRMWRWKEEREAYRICICLVSALLSPLLGRTFLAYVRTRVVT